MLRVYVYIDPLVQFGAAPGTAGQSLVQLRSALSKRPARSSEIPRAGLSVWQNEYVYYVYNTTCTCCCYDLKFVVMVTYGNIAVIEIERM